MEHGLHANDTRLLVVHVAVIYFLFLICICIMAIVFTIFVQRMHFHSETKPLEAMPAWVSTDTSKLIFTYHNILLPHNALECKARSYYHKSCVRPTVRLSVCL